MSRFDRISAATALASALAAWVASLLVDVATMCPLPWPRLPDLAEILGDAEAELERRARSHPGSVEWLHHVAEDERTEETR